MDETTDMLSDQRRRMAKIPKKYGIEYTNIANGRPRSVNANRGFEPTMTFVASIVSLLVCPSTAASSLATLNAIKA
jgi:hypothetical protein